MPDTFVDLSYRGLSLGRRIKLTQIRPSTGYLEHPTPMPVGTEVSIATDDGHVVVGTVMHVHEQVGGSDRPPGMTIKPLLDDALATWWKARVTMPELEQAPRPEILTAPRAKSVTVRPRTHTVPQPPPIGAVTEPPPAASPPARAPAPPPVPADAPAAVSPAALAVHAHRVFDVSDTDTQGNPAITDARPTLEMPAVQQEMLEQLSRDPAPSAPEAAIDVRTTGEHPVVDDGLRTTLMDAVDPSALGLEPTTSGSMPASASGELEASEDGDGDAPDEPAASTPDKPEPEPEKRGFFRRRKKKR